MKKVILFVFLLAMGSAQVQASYMPEWERPLYSGRMKVVTSQYGFRGVKFVKLTLTRKDNESNPTGLFVEYTIPARRIDGHYYPSKKQNVEFAIHDVKPDTCGSVTYYASLPMQNSHGNPAIVGARFSVALTDHTHRECKDLVPSPWVSHVRQGFGWCGTGDSTMELQGELEAVATPQ